MKIVPDQLAQWLPGRLNSLGTDGFGRSENREHLRKFFEISAEAIVQATLSALAREGKIDANARRRRWGDGFRSGAERSRRPPNHRTT